MRRLLVPLLMAIVGFSAAVAEASPTASVTDLTVSPVVDWPSMPGYQPGQVTWRYQVTYDACAGDGCSWMPVGALLAPHVSTFPCPSDAGAAETAAAWTSQWVGPLQTANATVQSDPKQLAVQIPGAYRFCVYAAALPGSGGPDLLLADIPVDVPHEGAVAPPTPPTTTPLTRTRARTIAVGKLRARYGRRWRHGTHRRLVLRRRSPTAFRCTYRFRYRGRTYHGTLVIRRA